MLYTAVVGAFPQLQNFLNHLAKSFRVGYNRNIRKPIPCPNYGQHIIIVRRAYLPMSTAKEKFELARQRYAATFERHLDNGVEFISDNVYIEPEVIITPGTVILPGCILRGKTVIAENCVIGPNTLLEDTIVEAGTTINASQCYESHIGPNNKIGPFTHVRTGTKTAEGCHLGAYVETKNADFAEGRHRGRPCLHRRRFHHRPRCARRCPEHRARQADRD